MKIQKIYIFFWRGVGGRVGGGQGGCERRFEVFEKIHQKKSGGGVGGVVGLGGRGGCERRIEVFEKIHKKKIWWGSGMFGLGRCSGWGWVGRVGGGQVGCERRNEVFVKIPKNIFFFFFFFLGGGGVGSGEVGGSGWM